MGQMSFSTKLAQRLNRKILPREISITADPTRGEFNKVPLLGSYVIDDEGVPARPVNLVERGVLKTLLMSRRPRKEIQQSNGHARAGVMGGPGVQPGNILVTTDNGKPYPQLKKDLVQMCKDQGLEFGLIIKTMDNPTITGVEDNFSFFRQGAQTENNFTQPVMITRVYVKDGREEPVRGISISELTIGNLKDIEAVGNDYYVMHRMMGSGGSMLGGYFALFAGRGQQDMGIPCSIVAPSLLFEELEFKKNDDKRAKPPLLPHPFFAK
jgi:predicted Zn-dependent protease